MVEAIKEDKDSIERGFELGVVISDIVYWARECKARNERECKREKKVENKKEVLPCTYDSTKQINKNLSRGN